MLQANHLIFLFIVKDYILGRIVSILSDDDEDRILEGIIWRSAMLSYASTSFSPMVFLISKVALAHLGIFSLLNH